MGRAMKVPRMDAARRSRLQKGIAKRIYGFASRSGADPDMAFLNYGYAPLDAGTPNAEPDRFGTALYDRVVTGATLEDRDVLEVGCGRGGGAAALFARHHPRSVVGLDLAPSAVQRATRDHARPGLSFVEGDAEALPFPDERFDVVVNVESAHWYPDVPRFLAEVARVLRPGGRLMLADVRHTALPEQPDGALMPRADMGTLVAQLAACPLVLDEEEDVTPNVLRALELDSARRREMIRRSYPRLLQRRALEFSGVVGTPVHEALAKGELTYRRFALHKP